MAHLLGNDLISNRQYGFVKGRSTALQLLQILDKWIDCLENGRPNWCCMHRFWKSVWQGATSLSSYGISKTIIKWIQDFLTARKFRVRVNISHSAWSDVTSGIPKGSVLGSILFLLFINDLTECCIQYSEIYLFADDAKLFRHITKDSDETELQNGVNAL